MLLNLYASSPLLIFLLPIYFIDWNHWNFREKKYVGASLLCVKQKMLKCLFYLHVDEISVRWACYYARLLWKFWLHRLFLLGQRKMSALFTSSNFSSLIAIADIKRLYLKLNPGLQNLQVNQWCKGMHFYFRIVIF
jgi:hypothetical protein